MLSDTQAIKSKADKSLLSNKILINFSYYAFPIGLTGLLGTYTYPKAVKIARNKRLLGLRNFYAIHVAIAPFLALIHLNTFATLQGFFKAYLHE